MAALHLDSGEEADLLVDNEDDSSERVAGGAEEVADISKDDDDDDMYRTPPSSPPESVYICEGIPSKEDGDLILALQLVDPDLLRQFGAISEYVYKVQKVPLEERSEWPASDSPRAKKRRQRI
ncbi:unnamed protein product [Toxocara canis]|nr:unnamed protein product [Toxocara canis]